MKSFLKKSLVASMMLISTFSVVNLILPASAHAIPASQTVVVNDGGSGSSGSSGSATTGRSFGSCDLTLGLTPWDCGVVENPSSEAELINNARTIATNIATDISVIAAYLVIGYVIYGGYLYIFASGDTGKLAAGKKTLTHAFIGLAIVGLVNVILNSIHIALLGSTGAFDGGPNAAISAENVVRNMIDWFIGAAGIVAAIFLVVGGIGYITSSGDAAKLQKAKNTIFYALLGLTIVALSLIISNFVIDLVNSADGGATGTVEGSLVIILNAIISIASTVCVVYVVLGGARYITSSGDPGKIQKAKSTILYACIGLVVCALAFAITNFAIGKINNSTHPETSLLENPIAFLEEKL